MSRLSEHTMRRIAREEARTATEALPELAVAKAVSVEVQRNVRTIKLLTVIRGR